MTACYRAFIIKFMNPKEKAQELYAKFQCHSESFHEEEHTKGCVHIAIDEIISALNITTGHCTLRKLDQQEVEMDISYWESVRSALNAL